MKIISCFVLLALAFPGLAFSSDPASSSDPSPEIALNRQIRDAAVHGETHVVLAPGTYHMGDTLVLLDLKGMEIDCTNVRLVMTRPINALLIKRCTGVTVRGLTVDYDPLPFTQGTVTTVSADGKTLHFEVHAGYRPVGEDMKTAPRHIFDPVTRHWKEGANVFASPQIHAGPDGRSGDAVFDQPQKMVAPGDLIAFDRRIIDHNGSVVLQNCGAVTLEDFWVQASPSLAISGRYDNDQTVLRRIRIAPGPLPEGATQERLLSSNADAVNFAYCRKGPLLDQCDISFMGDDGLNVHGAFLPVLRVDSPTELRIVRPLPSSDGVFSVVHPGDDVRFMLPGTFAEVGGSKIASVQLLPSPGDVTAAEVKKLFPIFNLTKPYCVYKVTLATPLDGMAVGQWIDIPAINCPGFVVQNSHFHDHRARGLRIEGSDGLVQGNQFERIGSAAIQVGPEIRYWREAGWVHNVKITGNTIRNVGVGGDVILPSTYTPGAITVCGRSDAPAPVPYPGNRDIDIENNQIDGCPVAAIFAYGVKGLTVKGNQISHVNTATAPEAGSENGLSVQGPIDVKGAVDAVVENNTISP